MDLGFCGLSFVFHFTFYILPLIHTQPVRGPVESHRAQNKSTGRTTAGEVVSTSPSLPSAHRDETKGAPTCPNAERWWPQVDDTKEDQRGQAPYKDRGIIENHFLTPDLSVQEVIGNQIPTSRRNTCTTKTGEYVDRDYYRLLRNTGPLPEELAHIDDEGKLLEVDARCLQYTDASFQSTFDYKSVSGY